MHYVACSLESWILEHLTAQGNSYGNGYNPYGGNPYGNYGGNPYANYGGNPYGNAYGNPAYGNSYGSSTQARYDKLIELLKVAGT